MNIRQRQTLPSAYSMSDSFYFVAILHNITQQKSRTMTKAKRQSRVQSDKIHSSAIVDFYTNILSGRDNARYVRNVSNANIREKQGLAVPYFPRTYPSFSYPSIFSTSPPTAPTSYFLRALRKTITHQTSVFVYTSSASDSFSL